MARDRTKPEGLEPIETASRDEIASLQLERMRWSVRHTYDNVAHYRSRCEERGVHPDDLKSLEDLKLFPFTVKKDLRDTYPYGMLAVPMDRIRRIHGSSGTTGKPIFAGYTDDDLDMWATVVARSLRAGGVRPGDKMHVAYGYGLFTGGLGAHYGAERLGCAVIPISGGMTERQVTLIKDLQPDAIMVTPSYMLVILEEMERQGVDPATSSLEVGVFGAEAWSEGMRQDMERRAGIHAVDIYGLTEVIGPGVANECIETKDGLHVWEDHFYPEIIDPVTEEVLPDGQEGELVFTTLTKQAMPVIRYRTRDRTRLLPGTARSMRRIEKITGRTDDMIILRGVNLFPSQIEEFILGIPELSPNFVCVLTRSGLLDELTVEVEGRPGLITDERRRQEVSRALQREVKNRIGVSIGVVIVEEGSLPRSVGKAQRILDHRPER
jgi:phenylacetate-CoA ligase